MKKGDFDLIAVECMGPFGYRVIVGIKTDQRFKSAVPLNYAVQYIPGDSTESSQLSPILFDALTLDPEAASMTTVIIPATAIYCENIIPGAYPSNLLNDFCKYWSIPEKEEE